MIEFGSSASVHSFIIVYIPVCAWLEYTLETQTVKNKVRSRYLYMAVGQNTMVDHRLILGQRIRHQSAIPFQEYQGF